MSCSDRGEEGLEMKLTASLSANGGGVCGMEGRRVERPRPPRDDGGMMWEREREEAVQFSNSDSV